jgi:hypothetical protein
MMSIVDVPVPRVFRVLPVKEPPFELLDWTIIEFVVAGSYVK